MQNVSRMAYQFTKAQYYNSLPIKLKDIISIANRNHWKVQGYDNAQAFFENYRLYYGIDLEDYSKNHNGFSVVDNGEYYIFVRDVLDIDLKTYIIAHEMGHIVLNHTGFGILGIADESLKEDDIQEDEANRFAMELLAPLPILKKIGASSYTEIVELGLLPRKPAIQQYAYLMSMTDTDLIDRSAVDILELYQDYIQQTGTKKKAESRLKRKMIKYAAVSFLLGILSVTTVIFSINLMGQGNILSFTPSPTPTPAITATPEPEPTQEPEITDAPQIDNTQQANNSSANAPAKKSSNTTAQSSGQSSGQNVQSQQTQLVEQQPAPAAEQPEVQPRQNVQAQAPVGGTVYITNTGDKYHKADCPYLKSCIPISLSEAQRLGYTPCYRCYKQ